jgi:hypothetical protein
MGEGDVRRPLNRPPSSFVLHASSFKFMTPPDDRHSRPLLIRASPFNLRHSSFCIQHSRSPLAAPRPPLARDRHHTRALHQSQRGARHLPIIAIAMGDRRLTNFIAMTLLAVVAFAACSHGSGDDATCRMAAQPCSAPPCGMVRQATNAATTTPAPLLAPSRTPRSSASL